MSEIINRLIRKFPHVKFIEVYSTSVTIEVNPHRYVVTDHGVACQLVEQNTVCIETPAAKWLTGVLTCKTRNDDGVLV